MSTQPIAVRIVGRGWPTADPLLHLGLQRGKDVCDVRSCDGSETHFDFALDLLVDGIGGTGDWRGPLVHGSRGGRFLYLSWGQVSDDGTFEMSSRAKLPLPTLDQPVVDPLYAGGATLMATLALADTQGRPISGSVRPPRLIWSVI